MFQFLSKIIEDRRSVRSFNKKALQRECLDKILYSAILAPSGKNRQPWRFVVASGRYKADFISFLCVQVESMKAQQMDFGSLAISCHAMQEAHTLVFVFNPYSLSEPDYSRNRLLMDTQSLGAAIEHILLCATALGVSSLWINDIYYRKEEIRKWLGSPHELVAVVALGYSDKKKSCRVRKKREELVEFRS